MILAGHVDHVLKSLVEVIADPEKKLKSWTLIDFQINLWRRCENELNLWQDDCDDNEADENWLFDFLL